MEILFTILTQPCTTVAVAITLDRNFSCDIDFDYPFLPWASAQPRLIDAQDIQQPSSHHAKHRLSFQ
jgi:hypothetical protein